MIFALLYAIGIARPMQASEALVEREAAALAESYIVEGPDGLVVDLRARVAQPARQHPFHVFIDRQGRTVSANMPSWPARPYSGWRRIDADLPVDGDEDDYEALTLDRVFDDGARLLVGRDIEYIDEREEFLGEAALWTALITLLLGIAGGVMMSQAVGRRIDAVTRTARSVIGGDLAERVPVRGTGDDFDQLADTLNVMLARIEELVESVRRVSDSVAHELRTPLARLKADLDDLGCTKDAEEARRLGRQATAEASRLQSIFDALLRIARIESGRHAAGVRTVDLTALLNDTAEYYLPQAESRNQRLTARVQEGLTVQGDPDLLFQAVSNLLDNALKYTPPHGEVTLLGQRLDDELSIGVLDTGPGIPPEHLPQVTERFYRASRDQSQAGLGLGLSLVAAVASLHQGSFGLSNVIGLYAEIRVPAGAARLADSGRSPK